MVIEVAIKKKVTTLNYISNKKQEGVATVEITAEIINESEMFSDEINLFIDKFDDYGIPTIHGLLVLDCEKKYIISDKRTNVLSSAIEKIVDTKILKGVLSNSENTEVQIQRSDNELKVIFPCRCFFSTHGVELLED